MREGFGEQHAEGFGKQHTRIATPRTRGQKMMSELLKQRGMLHLPAKAIRRPPAKKP